MASGREAVRVLNMIVEQLDQPASAQAKAGPQL